MSLVTWPCRNDFASGPVSASLPRSERSTTNVLTDERLAFVQARQPALDLRLELLHHPLARHAGLQRRAHDRRLLGAVQAREQREQSVEVHREVHVVRSMRIMALADTFQEMVDSLPSDWTDMELDLRVEEDRYVDAASLMVTCNAQPYSHHDWHWRIIVAHQFGHAAAAPVVHGTLKLLDDAGIAGELVLREVREGRVETTQMWGRPESVRQEFRRIRAQ